MSNFVPEGWSKTTLSKIAKLTMGQSPSSDTYNVTNDGLPFFQGNADFGSRYPKVRCWCNGPTKIADEKSILFSVRAPVGEVNITLFECCIGRGLAAIKGESADQEFLFQSLQYAKPRIQLLSQGSTFEAINGTELKEFDLTLPPLPEQQKIATILSSVDEVIEKTRAQIDKLKDLKTGMMQELLTKGIGHTEFKDSPVGQIPAAWEVLSIGSLMSSGIIEAVQDGNHGEKHPKSSDFVKSGIPFVMASDIHNQEIDIDGAHKISEEIYQGLRIGFAKPGDVLLSHKATVGLTAIVPDRLSRLMLTPQVTYYRIGDESRLLNVYLYYWFQSPVFQEMISLLSAQSTRSYIGIKAQQELLIALPCDVREQRRIVTVLSSIDDKTKLITAKLSLLNNQKKALMQDLLTGKVRVNVTDNKLAATENV